MVYIEEAAKFLHDTGLLFEINRQVLHPLGLALEVNVMDDGQITFGRVWDCRADPEGILFDEDTLRDGYQKHQAYMAEHGAKALVGRKRSLGFTAQTFNTRPWLNGLEQ